ncbi:carbonic anhydrase [Vibrio hepatarius]|uniref:carbonic anhydrase n=1 Tax=Vibrio hepatarius TaxID=171383 RepID=UPI002FDA7872
MKKNVVALALLTAVASSSYASDWGYEGEHGPEHWGNVAAECAQGKNQSPIDIHQPVEADLVDLNINYTGVVTGITNNGHTLQAKVEGANTFKVDGVEFSLAQFHFHTPSENTIKSQHYPLEAHFVNADKDGNLAVIAVMFDQAQSSNPQLAQLLEAAPKKGETISLSNSFKLTELLPKEDDYYRFNGSLTTPPCSEGVRWFVMKEAKSLSAGQIGQFEQAMGHNNRPVQPLNARKVLTD